MAQELSPASLRPEFTAAVTAWSLQGPWWWPCVLSTQPRAWHTMGFNKGFSLWVSLPGTRIGPEPGPGQGEELRELQVVRGAQVLRKAWL